jgi:hypothetical protein
MIDIILTKPRSPKVVRIFSDRKDPHFANVEITGSRTGKIEKHYIVASDVPQWRGIYERNGFIITEQDDKVIQN